MKQLRNIFPSLLHSQAGCRAPAHWANARDILTMVEDEINKELVETDTDKFVDPSAQAKLEATI